MLQDEQTPVRRSRARVGWLLAGVVVIVAVLVGVGFAVWYVRDPTMGALSEEQHQTYQHQADEVDLDLDGGRVAVSSGADGQVQVARHLQWRDTKPVITEQWSGNTLHITTNCGNGRGCSTDYTVQLPASAAVTVRNRGGSITSDGVHGALQLETDGGDIKVSDTKGTLVAHSEGGSITGTDLSSPSIEATSTGGTVRLTCNTSPDKLTARSTGGDIDVAVPRAGSGPAGYQVRIDDVGGAQHSEVPDDVQGQHLITVGSEGGSVKVHYN